MVDILAVVAVLADFEPARRFQSPLELNIQLPLVRVAQEKILQRAVMRDRILYLAPSLAQAAVAVVHITDHLPHLLQQAGMAVLVAAVRFMTLPHQLAPAAQAIHLLRHPRKGQTEARANILHLILVARAAVAHLRLVNPQVDRHQEAAVREPHPRLVAAA